MKGREFKRIWGKPWDFGYLLKLEQYKIREMCEYIKKYHTHLRWEDQVREMTICIKLIDIILEEDTHFKSWLHNCYGCIPHKNLPFPVYVNIKNCNRFIPDLDIDSVKKDSLFNHYCSNLRKVKAMHLYNKIRAYKMWGWWD